MFIYNVTFNLEKDLLKDWNSWVRQRYIPYAMESKCFTKSQLMKIHTDHDQETLTFCCQLSSDTPEGIHVFCSHKEELIISEMFNKFGEKCLIFPTVLEFLD